MGKTAFIFPGQGAQYCGMGKDFYEEYETARAVYEAAKAATGLDVAELCFTENDRLNVTEYTQIAMLATEVAILKVLEENGVRADVCAGLSLGEYGALAAAGVMELPDLFRLIRSRGIFMQEAYPEGGAMTAVLGLDAETIRAVCEATEGIVSIANDNCPGQIVITGEAGAVSAASQKLSEAGAKRCVPLKVSGPFHSRLLAGAGEKLAAELEGVAVKAPKIPYICNVQADYVRSAGPVKELLAKQVSGTVRWRETMERMLADGVDTFVEIGPGKTLAGFLRKMSREARVVNIQTVEDIKAFLETQSGKKTLDGNSGTKALDGKVALVTGAGRGIGRAIALALAAEGATVLVNYNGSRERALETVAEIEKNGGSGEAVGCDVSDFEACGRMAEDIIKKYSRLDILVNNAGITRDNLLMRMTEKEFDDVVSTNLKGAFNTVRHLSRYFLKQRSGRIINISSVSGVAGNAGQANYSASKAGIIGLTKSVARELASRGICVNAVAPGFVDTEMTQSMPEKAREAAVSMIPLGRMGSVDDIARTVVFLAGDGGSYITGQVLCVDGGMAI